MNELEKMLCGRWLGSGIHRAVHVNNLNRDQVVKIALGQEGRAMNLIEAKIWSELKHCKFAKWFAPVHHLSDAGQFMIMERAEFGRKQDYPDKVPHFFMDRKYNNYGFIKGQLKCIDYANTIITNGFTDKMMKANWWE